MEKAKISHALYHIVSVYFLEVCQATWRDRFKFCVNVKN